MVHIVITRLLIFSTYALSIKREGHNLKKKKKKGNIAVAAVVAFLCGYALKSAVLRYCGYRDSPTWRRFPFSIEASLLTWQLVECSTLWCNSVAKHLLHRACFYIAACLAPPTDSRMQCLRERRMRRSMQKPNYKDAAKTTGCCTVPSCGKKQYLLCLPSDPNVRKEWMNFIFSVGSNALQK